MSEIQINSNGHNIDAELATERICRGIRGATTVEENSVEAILSATRELLYIIIRANEIDPDDVASAIFTTTADLNATYPALAARQLGWYDTALLCGNEMDVPGGLPRCIRILVHWNTSRHPKEIVHVYLRRAKNLRPDRSELPPIPMEEIAAVINMDEAALKVGSLKVGDLEVGP
jgi:chorismate mutase